MTGFCSNAWDIHSSLRRRLVRPRLCIWPCHEASPSKKQKPTLQVLKEWVHGWITLTATFASDWKVLICSLLGVYDNLSLRLPPRMDDLTYVIRTHYSIFLVSVKSNKTYKQCFFCSLIKLCCILFIALWNKQQ